MTKERKDIRRNGSRENSLKRTQGEVRQIRSNELGLDKRIERNTC